MKIKQIIIEDTSVFMFTDNPEEDIKTLVEKYENETSKIHLGYEEPILTKYRFLGKDSVCIGLWFDNEDVPDFYKDFKEK